MLAGGFVLRSFNDCDVPLALQNATAELQVFWMILDLRLYLLTDSQEFNSGCWDLFVL